MSWTYTDDYYKRYTRDTWNESADAYEPVRRNLDLCNPAMLGIAKPRPGEHVLDVGTGPGEPALTIGPMVLPGGKVLGVDLAERMIEIARGNAKARGAANVEFEVMDAEEMTLPESSFDLAVCRFGLQIVTDPEKCARSVHRMLKPGGRFVASVWASGDRVPAIHVIIGPMLEYATPDETGYLPTPYEMGGPGELVALLEKVGFQDLREERTTLRWELKDETEYLDAVLKGTPIGHSLREESEDVQKDVIAKTMANLQKWKTKDGISMPAECVLVSGSK